MTIFYSYFFIAGTENRSVIVFLLFYQPVPVVAASSVINTALDLCILISSLMPSGGTGIYVDKDGSSRGSYILQCRYQIRFIRRK